MIHKLKWHGFINSLGFCGIRNPKRFAFDWDKVTCKHCLKEM